MYLIKRTIKDILQNRFLNLVSIGTIAISILIVSAFLLVYTNASAIIKGWHKGIRLTVYLEDDIDRSMHQSILMEIQKIPGIDQVKLISKEEALQTLQGEMPQHKALFEFMEQNPLPDAFEASLTENFNDFDNLIPHVNRLVEKDGVNDVSYGQQWLVRFGQFLKIFRLIGIVLGIVFLLSTLFMVANTIRLILFVRRDEIEIMRLVGAEDRFIQGPFFIQGFLLGFIGAIVGIAMLFGLYSYVSNQIQDLAIVGLSQLHFLPIALAAEIVFCCGIMGLFGSYTSLKYYLRD